MLIKYYTVINIMKAVVVALVGETVFDNLFAGIKEFPTEKVYLITTKERLNDAKKVVKDLERFKIAHEIVDIEGNIWDETFSKMAEIKKKEFGKEIIVNVGTADPLDRCVATSAAFVNGLKAIEPYGDEINILPVLKFSYYNLLTQKKMLILKTLQMEKDCCGSLEMLSKKTGMSLPLISYHINGSRKTEGLKQLGLIETIENGGKIQVRLTTLGNLLVKGYVDQKVN